MAKHLAQRKQPLLPALKEGLTKKQIAAMAEESIAHILDEGQVFQVAEALAAMDEFVKTMRRDERYVQFLRDELAKHGGKTTTPSGARIEACEAGITYNYSRDLTWQQMDNEIKELTERKKLWEEQLRRLNGQLAVDPETGEMIEGAMKNSKSTYRITLAK